MVIGACSTDRPPPTHRQLYAPVATTVHLCESLVLDPQIPSGHFGARDSSCADTAPVAAHPMAA